MSEALNPFLSPSPLPYQLPPFGDILDEHFRPAFETGMAEQRAQVAAIATSAEAPTFENTMLALERSGQILDRVSRVFFNKSSADSNPVTTALEEEIAPLLAAHHDAIRLDPALYGRIADLHDRLDSLELDAESRYLVERYFTEFTLAGAGLGEQDKEALRALNSTLSTLTTRFEKNLLADTNELAVIVDDVAELDGLTAGEISAAAEAANQRGLDGRYLITLVLPTGHPSLASLTNREVRERIMRASRARGIRGGEFDNRDLVLEITALRAARARLLGFDSHAAFVTADQTAQRPENVAAMMDSLAPAAARNARVEQADLQAVADAADEPFTVQSWDWAFLTEQVRTARFAVDTAAMRPYFEAERVLTDGIFFAASRLFGIRFTERTDLVAYHGDVRVFEVTEGDGTPVGLYLLDLYTRDSKRGGAWMNPLISQNSLLDQPTVVVNNLNVPKPAAGQPTLLSFDEVTTFFHEFGHALHGLFARVTYPRFAGTNVFRDFVEFPSQVNEMWMLWPEVLENYAVHYETGERMPRELVDNLRPLRVVQRGFPDQRVPGGRHSRPGLASHPDRVRHRRCGRLRSRCPRCGGPGQSCGTGPVLQYLLRTHIFGRIRRRLLLLHLERSSRRGCRGMVHRERRADARER